MDFEGNIRYYRFYTTFTLFYKIISATLFEIFIFCPKIQLWFPEKMVDFWEWKTRENVVVVDFLAVDNFDITRKIAKKIGRKTRENVGVLSKLNFWTKIWLFE